MVPGVWSRVAIVLSFLVVGNLGGFAIADEASQAISLKKRIQNGDIREGFLISKRKMRFNSSPFWKEQFVIFAIHKGFVNKRNLSKRLSRAAKSCVVGAKDRGHALATLAILFALTDRTQSAIKVANEALKMDSKNARATMALGLALKGNGEVEKAKNTVLKAVTDGAGDPDVMFLAYRFYLLEGNSPELLNVLNLWIKTSPECAYAHYLKGLYFDNALAFSMAVKEYKKAISLNPEYWLAKKNYAHLLTYQKKFKDAASIFDSILPDRRAHGVSYVHYGECLEGLGAKKKAIENYTIAIEEIARTNDREEQIEVIPQMKPVRQKWAIKAWSNRARLLMDSGDMDKALLDANAISNLFPMKMEPRYIKMLVLMRIKEYEKALQEANLLISANDDISLFYRKRSEINEGLKRTKDAQKDIELANRLERTGSIHDSGE